MNNEPVAYIDPYDLERLPHYDCHIGSQQLKNGIPLYTHPNEHDLGIAEAIGFDDGFKAGMQRAVEIDTNKSQNDNQIDTYRYAKLTDEEIMDAYADHCKTEASGKGNLIDFARAILKKASEK